MDVLDGREVLEQGDIAFFYRPKVQPADALVEIPGVQSFFVVLSPAGGGPARRLRIGRKRMPSARGQRFWVQVERVGSFQRVLADQLEDERYTTKTRGERYQPGARAVAQGTYAFVRHDDHTHLEYTVEHAEPLDDLPEEVRVPAEASYVVLFERRPRTRATWTTDGSPDLLDRADAEIVLVGIDAEHDHAYESATW
ncbi:MAG TPA: hypothetical protein VM261_02060 [Kofleriaceae bacterium]|nr:hypothetical protein [Kofleriaceae bacterium]